MCSCYCEDTTRKKILVRTLSGVSRSTSDIFTLCMRVNRKRESWYPANREYSWNSQVEFKRAAIKKLREHLKIKMGISQHRLKINEAIRIFANYYGLTPEGSLRKWLFKLYVSGENDFLKREDASFYQTFEWLRLRQEVINMYGAKCMKCGATNDIAVDHINPRSKYPELELDINNMQVLCRSCNSSKSNRIIIDYR